MNSAPNWYPKWQNFHISKAQQVALFINWESQTILIWNSELPPAADTFSKQMLGRVTIILVVSICPSFCLFIWMCSPGWIVQPLTLFLVWGLTLTLARRGSKVKVVGQRSRSNSDKSCFVIIFWRSEVKMKVWSQDQSVTSRWGAWCMVAHLGI